MIFLKSLFVVKTVVKVCVFFNKTFCFLEI